MKETALVLACVLAAFGLSACGSNVESSGEPESAPAPKAINIDVVENGADAPDESDFAVIRVNGVPCIYMETRPDGAGADVADLECDFTKEHFEWWVGDNE